MGAPDLSSLALDEDIVSVGHESDLLPEEAPEPVVVVSAEEVDLRPAPGAVVQRVENIEVPFGDDRRVLEIEVEDVTEQEHGGPGRHTGQEVDEPAATVGFARTATIPEVRVREKERFAGGDVDVFVHAECSRAARVLEPGSGRAAVESAVYFMPPWAATSFSSGNQSTKRCV